MKAKDGLRQTVSKLQLSIRWLTAIWNVLSMAALIGLLLLNVCALQSRLGGRTPKLANFQLYIVSSGSMRPTFDTGSLVVARPAVASEIAVGDIIVYRNPVTRELTTHRVVEIIDAGGLGFITKGDANQSVDILPVPAANVVGRVVFAIPRAGYLVNFAQTTAGLVVLFIVPGLLIIAFETRNLIRYVRELDEENQMSERSKTETSGICGEKQIGQSGNLSA